MPSALAQALAHARCAEIRLRSGVLYAAVYRADDEILSRQRSYGISDLQTPVLHLRAGADDALPAVYREAFERIWAGPPSCE